MAGLVSIRNPGHFALRPPCRSRIDGPDRRAWQARYDRFRQRPKSGRKWSRRSKSLCSSACSGSVTFVKLGGRTRRLPLVREKVSSIANTGYARWRPVLWHSCFSPDCGPSNSIQIAGWRRWRSACVCHDRYALIAWHCVSLGSIGEDAGLDACRSFKAHRCIDFRSPR